MGRHWKSLLGVAPAVVLCAGCVATQHVADPAAISLQHALVDTVDALSAANSTARSRGTNFGFYGCSVTAVFNVSATANQDNKLALSAVADVVPVTLTGTASSEAVATGTRANTVTVVLNTPYCMPGSKVSPPDRPGPVIPRPQ